MALSKICVDCSTWKNIYKGVPQGSILGPVLLNIFLNDIFNFVEESILYNYADDNTSSYSDTALNKVVDVLKKDSLNLIHWFSHNQMKANPINSGQLPLVQKLQMQVLVLIWMETKLIVKKKSSCWVSQ
jgi:hypothetical protein